MLNPGRHTDYFPRDFQALRIVGGWEIVYHRRKTGFKVAQDEKHSAMWRVKFPDGHLSDMVNASRAVDAALQMACLAANKTSRFAPAGGSTFVIPVRPLSCGSQDSARRKIGRVA